MNHQPFQKLKSIVAQLGLFNAVIYVIQRQLPKITDRATLCKYEFVAQPVQKSRLLTDGRGSNITVRTIAADDPVVKLFPRPPEVIHSRYNQDAICLGAFKSETFIGYIWLLLGTYSEDEVRCHFKPMPEGMSAWDFDIYLKPEHRLGMSFARLWDEANAYLRARNIEWTMSRISTFNMSSLKSHLRMGAQRTGSALFIGMGSLQLTIATVAPFFHFCTNLNKPPEIHLYPPRH